MNTKKKLWVGIVTMALGLGASSCSDYLDTEKYFTDLQTEEHIFENRDYTMQWLAYAYSRLQGDNLEIGHTDNCPTNYSDDLVFNEGNNGDRYRKYKMGEYGYGYNYQDYYGKSWPLSYDGIRQASILINNVDRNIEMTQSEITDVKGQARFLRAYFYWLLLRQYGPVPILPTEGANYELPYDELSFPRNSYDECVDFIASEMLQAAKELSDTRLEQYYNCATKIAALGIRAKVLLYAASPLANGNTEMADFVDNEGRILISQEYDESKWAKAAAAARDVIEYAESTGRYHLYTAPRTTISADDAYPVTVEPPYHEEYSNQNFPNGWADIDPFESYRAIFNGDLHAIENPELLFTRGLNDHMNDMKTRGGVPVMVEHQLPASCGGYNCHGVTQKQCDAYDMADGTPFNRETSLKGFTSDDNKDLHPYDNLPNDVWLEYANREPRFYASVAYCGSIWPNTSATDASFRYMQIFYYRGSGDGRTNSSERWVVTGIGVKKYVNPSDCKVNGGSVVEKCDPTLRYADILLMYAEALNNLTTSYQVESWDGRTYTISRDINEMRRGVKPVRMRAGMPDYSDAVYNDRDLFFERLVHERQIEFLGENQRYFDLRRWKIAEENEGAQIYGCNTMMTSNNREEFYNVVRVPNLQTTFARKMYFWPVSYDELKRNKNMTQAPGWQYYD